MTFQHNAPLVLIQAVSGSICLAIALNYVSRQGGLTGMRLALTVLVLGTTTAIFSLLGASFESATAGALGWHAAIRASIGFMGAGALGAAVLLFCPRAPHVAALVHGVGALLATLGVWLTIDAGADHFVRTPISWFPTAPQLRLFDTAVVGLASLAVTAGAFWRLVRREPYGRTSMWVLLIKQAVVTLSFVLIRWKGSPELVQTYLVFLTAPSTLIVWGALRNWRVAGVDDSAFKLMFRSTPLPTVLFDLHTNAVLQNPPAQELFGAQSGAQQVVRQLSLAGSPRDFLANHAGGKLEDVRVEGAEGRCFELRIHFDPDRAIGLVLLIDVTERVEHAARLAQSLADLQQMQQRLVQNEKMAALGILVAGVNHEINNPLAFTSANIRSATEAVEALLQAVPLARRLDATKSPEAKALRVWADSRDVVDAEADVLEALSEASDGAARIKDLTASMRMLSRQGEQEAEADLAEIVRAGLKIGRTNLPPGIKVAQDLAHSLPIHGAAGELSRVIANLVVNAGQSMGDQGRLSLRAFEEGGCAVLEVSDDGPGVPPQHRARIFDPFFTTKSPGQGTGLGLAISFETARRHHGELRLLDREVPGATFQLRIPLAHPVAVKVAG